MQANSSSTAGFSPWSLTLGSVRGIPVRLHISFLLLLFWVGLEDASAHQPSIHEFLFLTLVFLCVFLHELGHALTAKRFGVRTRDIMLYPFGGVASLMGELKPRAELIVALAGPLVNLAIAGLLYPIIDFTNYNWFSNSNSVYARLFETNLLLAIFNFLPALPMDGGRILRSVLALLNIKNATLIASRTSQVISFSLGAFAIYAGNVMLLVISVFVFLQAMQELVREKAKIGAEGHALSEVMLDRNHLRVLNHGATVSEALRIALKSEQDLFPVVFGDQLMGVVSRDAILQNAVTQQGEQYVSGIMEREFASVSWDAPLHELMERLERDGSDPIIVLKDSAFVGLVRRDKLIEFLYIQAMRKQRDLIDDSMDEEFQI